MALASSLAVACSPAVAPAPDVTAVSIAATDPPAVSSKEPEVSAQCKLTTEEWGRQGEGHLRFDHDEPPFVSFSAGRVHMTLGSPVRGIPTRVEQRGVVLEGMAVPADVGLYAGRPLLFGELAMPYGGVVLHWTGRTQDAALVLVHHLVQSDRSHSALKRAVACGDIRLDPTEFDPVDSLGETGEPGFLGEPTIAVSSTAEGAPVATLAVNQSTDQVSVLEKYGERARVVWPRKDEVIIGWIDANEIHQEREPDALEEYFGVGGLGLRGVGGASYWTCSENLDLYAKQGDRLWKVGAIAARTKVAMGVVNDGYRDVSLYVTHSFEAAEGVELLVREEVLAACSL